MEKFGSVIREKHPRSETLLSLIPVDLLEILEMA
jgi:hypothetical protein